MKNIKKLLVALIVPIGLVSTGFLATSCKDDLTEEDILNLGTEADELAKTKAVEALNAAGQMVSFQIKIVDTKGKPVDGLNVSMVAASEGGVADDQALVTDASGAVFFDRVAIGGNTVSISGENIVDALVSLDFGPIRQGIHYQMINGEVVPTPVTESAVLTVLGSGTSTATVKGIATIETDLTNDTKEVPQDITIAANLKGELVQATSVDNMQYILTSESIGSATVDNATGAYTIAVPAGVAFDLVVPEVQANQRVAINGLDDKDLAQPEYRDILTSFGYNDQADEIPTVPGARILFDAPKGAGEGFSLALSEVGRSLPGISFSASTPQLAGLSFVAQFLDYGSGYVASPKVTITDPTGSDAYARAELTINSITAATLTAAGTGYDADEFYDFDFEIDYLDEDDGSVQTFTDYGFGDNMISVTTDENGEFTQAAFDEALVTAIGNFFTNPITITNYDIVEMRIIQNDNAGADAVYTVTAADSKISEIQIIEGGSEYTNPTFTIPGAELAVHGFGTRWEYTVDNSNVTTPYTVLPQSIEFQYEEVTVGGGSEAALNESMDGFRIDDSGNVQFKDVLVTEKTTSFYAEATPKVIIKEPKNIAASRYINASSINKDGQITSIDEESDHLMDFVENDGRGYDDVFGASIRPAIEGAPGSGAAVEVVDGTFLASGEYTWGGNLDITNQGSGYLQNLNVQGATSDFSVSGSIFNITLEEGATRIVNISYGTGDKHENVH
ncbi:hypothetical protein [Flagellimonas pacifica]|uniref:Carboxypeptidase regulatory-like domain-containing protein n=1 Tax=Flagellimonas pacifica TaxID=1247520 RepID=A0A285MSN0_9FLAO|nr:hypothetical protein [Allomuricauda parva]SNZ00128.1 hypothetical protein SAMN06265377_1945 [Allomuricauda parva]